MPEAIRSSRRRRWASRILYAGKEVVIHLTCKDLNRNGLESEAWMLNSEGFHNILAMTGDYPAAGDGGLAKPVFDHRFHRPDLAAGTDEPGPRSEGRTGERQARPASKGRSS